MNRPVIRLASRWTPEVTPNIARWKAINTVTSTVRQAIWKSTNPAIIWRRAISTTRVIDTTRKANRKANWKINWKVTQKVKRKVIVKTNQKVNRNSDWKPEIRLVIRLAICWKVTIWKRSKRVCSNVTRALRVAGRKRKCTTLQVKRTATVRRAAWTVPNRPTWAPHWPTTVKRSAATWTPHWTSHWPIRQSTSSQSAII